MRSTHSWRILAVASVAMLALAGCSTPATGGDGEPVETVPWRHHTLTPEANWITPFQGEFLDLAAKESGGILEPTQYPGASLGFSAGEALRSIADGLADSGVVYGGHISGEIPIATILELPYLVPADTELRTAIALEVWDEWEAAFAEQGVVLLGVGQEAPRQVFTTDPADSISDLAGRQIRAGGADESEFTNSLGMGAVTIDPNEMFTSLQQGVVDGYWDINASTVLQGWSEAICCSLQFNSGGATAFLIASQTSFDKLPEEAQQALRDAGRDFYSANLGANAKEKNEQYSGELDDMGIEQTELSDADFEAARQKAEAVWDSWADRAGPAGAALLEKVKGLVADAE